MAERQATLMKLVDPVYLSLVTTPANQTGFKIIRDATGGTMSHTDRNPRIRQKAARAESMLLAITLPSGVTEDEAKEYMDAFALGDDYELYTELDGSILARRLGADLDSGISINLGNGFSALVQSSATTKRADSAIAGVTLVGLEFDENFATVEAVRSWMSERDVNFAPNGVEVLEGGVAVTRHDVPDGVEVRKVRLDTGVTGLVTKTKNNDVPRKVLRSVVEQAYGNWGWGHLDFLSAQADPAFTDEAWNAIYVLKDVLSCIILNSGLPLDERKMLVQNALTQFTSYVNDLMDALPREVINQARADRQTQQEPPAMTKKTEDTKAVADPAPVSVPVVDPAPADTVTTEPVAVADPAAAAADPAVDPAAVPAPVQAGDKNDGFVTRADMEAAITAAVSKAVGDMKVARADGSGEILGAIQTLTDGMNRIIRSVEDVKKEVDEVTGTTLTRSSPGDGSPTEGSVGVAKRGDDSPFVGMFGGRFGGK